MDIKNQIREYIKKSPERFGLKKIDKIELKELPKGLWNFNFIVLIEKKKFVFRIFTPNRGGFFVNSGKKEFEVLKILSETNLAPRPILFDDSKKVLNYEILVEEFIEGEQLKDLEINHIKKIAQLLARLHSIEISKDTTIEKKDYRIKNLFDVSVYMIDLYSKKEYFNKSQLEEFNKIFQTIKEELTPIPEFEEKESIIHMDLVASNFLTLKNGDIKLVDWQSPGIGDPAFDVWAFTNKAFNLWDLKVFMNEEQKKLFLDVYLKFRKDETLIKRIKSKKNLWILILIIHSLIQYQDFLAGKVDKILTDRKDKFIQYKKAFERGLAELKEELLS